MNKQVIKRDGKAVPFNIEKIVTAIRKANAAVEEPARVDEAAIHAIADKIEATEVERLHVEDIQDMVEKELVAAGKYKLAKAYILYRYEHALRRKANTTDKSILSLIRNDNKDVMEENSNKNAVMASTQRDLIAGEVSKDITMRLLLPEEIAKAHEDGVLHFHDMDYFISPLFNCCLINIGDMLDNGTVMNGKMIESPKSFQVACNVMTQIIACVASNQYGGQSVDMRHLGKYLHRSEEKLRTRFIRDLGKDCPQAILENAIASSLKEELKAGVQTIQYQINTLMTTNGQSPFVTLFLNLQADDPYIRENAMIIEEVLRQRLEGIKNEAGVYVTPAFPKLVYVLDEHNCLRGGKYDYLTHLAAECSAKRMYPDYISAKKMRENYEGNVFSPMGCVAGIETVRLRINGKKRTMMFMSAWSLMETMFPVKRQKKEDFRYLYMDVEGIEIFDTKKNDYVKVYRFIRNVSTKWIAVQFSSGKGIMVTEDHPFSTENHGIVQAKDLCPKDQILTRDKNREVVTATPVQMEKSEIPAYSYDVTTESEHFEVSGVYSHNCRSFLSAWKNEKGEYQFEGRFNQGVVSLNLPQIGILAKGDDKTFWNLLDKRLELCRKALMVRHNALLGTKSDVSPIHWQYGAIARLKKGEVIDPYLNSYYSTLSLGYIGLYELTMLMRGVSHTTIPGEKFAVSVLQYLRNACDKWKKETGLGFALYGTPAESLCYRFARVDKKRFGDIPNVTDKGYYTNSYHVDVREEIDAFSKLEFESQFQKISSGGAISYVEVPNMQKNPQALETVIKFIYNHIQYAEFNTKSDYCMACGYDGEILINEEGEWECPQCHNKDHNKMSVVRRTCGYLGSNFWNVGKTKEIKNRVLHL